MEAEVLVIDGKEYPVPHDLRDIIDHSLDPIKGDLTEIKTEVKSMSADIQEIKTSDKLQDRELELLKEKQKTQEEKINLLENKVTTLEQNLTTKIQQLTDAPQIAKGKRFDGVVKGISSIVISVITAILLAWLGISKLTGK